MRNLKELKRDLKKYWLDNGKDFDRLRDKISDNPCDGGTSYEEYFSLKGKNAKKKAKKLVEEWELEDDIVAGCVGIYQAAWGRFELEEKPLPRMVMVRDNDNQDWVERKLLCIIPGDMKYRYVCEFGEGYDYPAIWKQMKEIEEVPEYTVEELIEKLGHEFKIKK